MSNLVPIKVRTRTFSADVGGECVTLMVPYADLANHSVDMVSTFGVSKDRSRFELRSLGSPLSAGSEATISYGANFSMSFVKKGLY